MLYYLYLKLFETFSATRVFRYITIRSLLALMISFFIVLVLGKPFINYLKSKKCIEDIRDDGPSTHFCKKGTPTMGGVLIVISIILTILITGNLSNKFTLILLLITILFSAIGFLDDFLKFSEKNKKGLKGKYKIIGQVLIGILIWYFIYKFPLFEQVKDGLKEINMNFSLINPFIKDSYLYIGAFAYLLFIAFFITATSNSVNITDGLDGLAILPVITVCGIMAIIAYLTGRSEDIKYLNLYYVEGASEITVYLFAVVGSGLGFLWYNFYPAQIFMGDTGSLTLGGILGTVAICLKQELLIPIIGFVFVVEAVSVIIQVGSYKTRKKRVFKMAPIHHHFELEGLPETKVTIRFWIISLLCSLIGLIILKLR